MKPKKKPSADRCWQEPTPEELEEWIRAAEQSRFLEDDFPLSSSEDGPDPAQPGDIIGGYRIVEPIGYGGRSVVYRAEQLSVADREVAIKVYCRADDSEKGSVAPEVRALAQFEHANLARIIDAGLTPGGQQYVVTTLLNGVPIDEYCDTHKLSNREIAELLRKVCSAVQVLHRGGFVHCDLKPSNILVDDRGEPTVTDFDASKHQSDTTPLARGTIGYIAPEQVAASRYLTGDSNDAKTNRVGAAADVYGLGAILYRCLTGQVLFAGSSELGALVATLFDTPLAPTSICPTSDSSLERIRLRCLRKSPDERYPTVAALMADLDAYLDDQTSKDTPKGLRSKPLLASAGTAALVVLAVAVADIISWLAPVRERAGVRGALMPGLLPPTIEVTDAWQLETCDPRPGFQYARLSPARDQIAAMGNDSWLRVYALEGTLLRLTTMLSMEHPTHTTQRAISWHPDGDRIVASAGDSCAHIWSVKQSKRLARLSPGGEFNLVRDAQWSPDGNAIAIGCRSGLVQVYDSAGNLTGEFNAHQSEALRVRWSPDGQRIVSGDITGAIYVWDSKSFEVEHVLGGELDGVWCAKSIRAIEWHFDGERFAVGNEGGEVTVFDCEPGESIGLGNLGSPICSLEWSPDGRLFAGCKELVVYSVDTGWSVVSQCVADGLFESVEWDRGRLRLFTAGHQGQLELWNVDQETYDVLGHSNASIVRNLTWSPNARLLASAGSDGCVRLFDQDGRVQAVTESSPSLGGVHCVAWHPSGLLLASGNGRGGSGVEIFEVQEAGETVSELSEMPQATGEVTVRLLKSIPLGESIESVRWSNDGAYLGGVTFFL